jgi:type 1 fimbria pilin
MRFVKKLVLVAVAAVAVLAVNVTAASASEIASGGVSFTGHVIGGAVGTQTFATDLGDVECDKLIAEGTIENENIPSGSYGHVGVIDSFVYEDSNHDPQKECDATLSLGFTECQVFSKDGPFEVRANQTSATNVQIEVMHPVFELLCETSGGSSVHCQYEAASVVANSTLGKHTSTFSNQPLGLIEGGFLCPDSGAYSGSVTLKTESGAEVITR